MSLQNLKQQVCQLSVRDRLSLVSAIIQSLQDEQEWQYLVDRPQAWRKQLHIKGRKLLASTVWQDMIANQMTLEQAAENWDLPIAAIDEVVRYCESHQELLRLEAEDERDRLEANGVLLEPTTAA